MAPIHDLNSIGSKTATLIGTGASGATIRGPVKEPGSEKVIYITIYLARLVPHSCCLKPVAPATEHIKGKVLVWCSAVKSVVPRDNQQGWPYLQYVKFNTPDLSPPYT